MEKIKPLAEHGSTLDAFVDAPVVKSTILDRSDLENYTICPFMARAKQTGEVEANSLPLQAGNVVHDALSAATLDRVENWEYAEPALTEQNVMHAIYHSRPDLQPEAIVGIKKSLRAWSLFINGINHLNILAFDGGEKVGKSSQYSVTYPEFGVMATSEIDLLYSGDSKKVLKEVDYKSGWTPWSYEDVSRSFQFQQHAVLLFNAFPEVESIETSVWCTRFNRITHETEFTRKRLDEYEARLRSAIETYIRNQKLKVAECWPLHEKCSECEAILLCPEADKAALEVAKDPAAFIHQMSLVKSKLAKMQDSAKAYIEFTGEDIVTDNVCFGRNKPSTRKADAVLYEIKKTSEK